MAGMFPSNNCLSHKDRLYKAEKRIYLVLAASGARQSVVPSLTLALVDRYLWPDWPRHQRVPFGVQVAVEAGPG